MTHNVKLSSLVPGFLKRRNNMFLCTDSVLFYYQGVTRVNLVISITLQGNSFPVRSHMWIGINGHSFTHQWFFTEPILSKLFIIDQSTGVISARRPFTISDAGVYNLQIQARNSVKPHNKQTVTCTSCETSIVFVEITIGASGLKFAEEKFDTCKYM